MSLISPFDSPSDWSYSVVTVELPGSFRYGGYSLRAIRGVGAATRDLVAPAAAAVRGVDDGTTSWLELELLPFALRAMAEQSRFGWPTLYFSIPAAAAFAFSDHELVSAGGTVATVTQADFVLAFPDRVQRDPLSALESLRAAITASAGDTSAWQGFLDAFAASRDPDARPVLLLDHTGAPIESGRIEFQVGGATREVQLAAADGGDLQKAIARVNAADASTMPISSLWAGGATSASIRPIASPGGSADFQLSRLEDATGASSSIAITPAQSHVLITDLNEWFAQQFALVGGVPLLERFTRGNEIEPLINGPEYFADLFRSLEQAQVSNGGFHLAGWSMDPVSDMTKPPSGAGSNFPVTLKQAAEQIAAAGGSSRFLAVDFIQLADPSSLATAEIVAFYTLVNILLILKALDVGVFRTDGSGAIIIVLLLIANAPILSALLADGAFALEQNKDAVDELDPVSGTRSVLSPYPATAADNFLADTSGFPFATIFKLIRRFNVYHQKLAVVKTGSGFVGYCGGIDVNTNRKDDEKHLARSPYHDLHLRVRGPAVRDLALTFEQRWSRDGGADAPAFSTPSLAELGSPGSFVAQVGRTYFAAAALARELPFAPNGDRTLLDTLLQGISNAREFIYIEDQYLTPSEEYTTVLEQKISDQEIRQLIIVIPGSNDQPFGQLPQSDFITRLRAADTGGDIVRVGYPRRRVTVPRTDLRASSGRLRLMADLESPLSGEDVIALGPPGRIPPPPFWVCVDGELIFVYDEWNGINPEPSTTRIFRITRGAGTRIESGGATPKGTTERSHKKDAAVTLVELSEIYVHSKLMIVDDVFVSIGSANLNRRGFYSDGETNVFYLPEQLKAAPRNPVRRLRTRLWAEMLDIPHAIAEPLLDDPLAAGELFNRSYFLGNRFRDADTHLRDLMFMSFTGGDTLGTVLLQGLGFGILAPQHQDFFDSVVDPSSGLDPHAP
jgi:phosphatidylserine/phosphatidylglycerophosphate/cardiolipin synthase-like enzyme